MPMSIHGARDPYKFTGGVDHVGMLCEAGNAGTHGRRTGPGTAAHGWVRLKPNDDYLFIHARYSGQFPFIVVN